MTDALQAVRRGTLPLDERVTVEMFLDLWLEDASKSLRPKTVRIYEGLVRLHLIPGLGHVKLVLLTPHDVQRFLFAKVQEGLSPRTAFHLHAVLRTALNQAMRWELLHRNVATLAHGPRVPHRQVDPMAATEARKLLRLARGTDIDAILVLSLVLGARQGETLGLRWTDIDRTAQTVRVHRALQRVGGRYELVNVKTDRTRRVLPLPPLVLEALDRREGEQRADRDRAGRKWVEPIPGLIFTTPKGEPRNGSSVTHQYQKIMEAAGMPRRSFHALRHSAATLALSQGIDLKTVSTMLGHSQISLTANTYASVVPALVDEAVQRVGGLLSAPTDDASEDDPLS